MNACLVGCVRCTKWVPVLFLMSILAWAYYAYIVELCIYNIGDVAKKTIYIFLFHVFLLMFLWAYGMTVFTKPAQPTNEFYLEQADIYQLEIAQNDTVTKMIIEKKAKQLPILTRTNTLHARFCDRCKCIKPDRAHHCGTCQQCVLKMDHHCPWVNNCVGHSNYKFFILFLAYAFLFCMYIACTSFEYFVEFWNEIKDFKPGRFHLLFLFFVSIMFAISVFSLLAYHIYLVARNCTTLESFRAPVFLATGQPDPNGFNTTIRENFRQVFGSNLLLAVLPIKSQLIGGSDFTNQTRSNLRNGSANIKSSLDYNHSRGNSRITIIGSGWARSSNIYHEHQLGLENRTSKHMSQYLTIDNSLDYEDSKDSIEYERYNSTRNSKNSISFNNISTILKKNPNITIKTVVEHYSDPLQNRNPMSVGDGITYTESDLQRSERLAECRASPPNQSSDALLSNSRFQSVNEQNGIVMDH